VKHSHINLNLWDDIILQYPETIQEQTKGYKRVVLLLCMYFKTVNPLLKGNLSM
jgi:hypothetical protein